MSEVLPPVEGEKCESARVLLPTSEESGRKREEPEVDFHLSKVMSSINGGYKPIPKEELESSSKVDSETTCGFWFCKGPTMQKFANKKAFVILYGIVGCIISAAYAYFNGTITTIEKRYKIPSRNTGIISVGNDISTMLLSAVVSYYCGKGHRPRWIAFGLFTVVVYCLLTALPHFLYGPGEDALLLTTEYAEQYESLRKKDTIDWGKNLCKPIEVNGTSLATMECNEEEGNLMPQVVFFLAQSVSGIGGSLYYTLGVCYIDDNVKKSKTPALISLSYFLRMLGPAIGYSLASVSLKFYISPSLHPTINNSDPRWLGAWWLGWLVLGGVLAIFTVLLGMFPKVLPRSAARKQIEMGKLTSNDSKGGAVEIAEDKTSVKDMLQTFKRLLRNRTLMFNNFASIFYFFGFMPYWIFTPKYIEIQYHQSASVSSLVTGTVALVFSAIGVLISGILISKYKPRARYMAAWNVFVGSMAVMGMVGYIFLGCPSSDKSMSHLQMSRVQRDVATPWNNFTSSLAEESCFSSCQCDYVKYSPVCGQEDGRTYISACHAGCKSQRKDENGKKVFSDCSCVQEMSKSDAMGINSLMSGLSGETTTESPPMIGGGSALPGPCPVDCANQFYLFLAVMCFIKFTGATGRASNFLVSVRCVEEKDKPVSMGFSAMVMSLFSFIPSPIFFGYVLDRACVMWGKTCSGTGNCWLYDSESLRYNLNLFASGFVAIGTLLDVAVWYYVKDLKIFDEKVKEEELQDVEKEEEMMTEKP